MCYIRVSLTHITACCVWCSSEKSGRTARLPVRIIRSALFRIHDTCNFVVHSDRLCEEERRLVEEERQQEALRLLQNSAWLEREKLAQKEFRKKKEVEEKHRKEKEEREVCWVAMRIMDLQHVLF